MKNNNFIITVIAFFLVTASCKKTGEINYFNPKLIGYWQIDSITNIQGGNARSHLMDTLFGIDPNTTKRIILNFKEDKQISCYTYHFQIGGNYKVTSDFTIDFDLEEYIDFQLRPKSDWQPLVIRTFNISYSYRIEGGGGIGSRMYVYFDDGKGVLHCTKL